MNVPEFDPTHRNAGFTLIEVLAALVIVSLGMLGVIQAVNQTVNNTSYLREKSLAHWVAMNRLTEVRLAATAPSTETTHGTTQMVGRDWRWTMAVSTTDVSSMLRVDISVAAAEAGEKSSLASVSGFYGKAIAPAGTARVPWASNLGQPGQGAQTNSPTSLNSQSQPSSGGTPAATASESR